MAGKFVAWLDAAGYESYDPYDIWGTRYGVLARRLYYRKHPLGLAMTAPLILMEIVWPAAAQGCSSERIGTRPPTRNWRWHS